MKCLKTNPLQLERFEEFLKMSSALDKSGKIFKNGDNNAETAEWLWRKATKGKPFDLSTEMIESIDLKRYQREVKKFISNYGKSPGFFSRFFKLPKALVRNVQGGEEFYNNVAETMSFHQRQTKESAQHIQSMVDGLYNMIGTEGWAAGDFKKFQQLERNLIGAKTPEQKKSMITELIKVVGTVDNNNVPIGGKVLRRFQGLLDFTKLPKNGNERMIVREWNIMRANAMQNLLNGATMAKMAIRSKLKSPEDMSHLTRALDTIQEKIDALLIQAQADKTLLANPEKGNYEHELKVYNPDTKQSQPYRVFNKETGEYAVGIKKYSPSYVLELSDIMSNITEYALNIEKSSFKDKRPEAIYAEAQKIMSSELNTTRLKHRAPEMDLYSSLDPVYYLNKYAHDVSSFNARARIQYAFSEGTKSLFKQLRANKDMKGGDVGDYAREMIDMLSEIRDSSLNHHKGSMNSMDHLVQIINGFEYVSKLGFSVRGGLKNRTQGLFNWIFYGRKGYKRSSDFYDKSSREYDPGSGEVGKPRDNKALLQRQLRRFGLKMGDKWTMTSAATGGSLDVLYVPEGFSLDAMGKLIPETKSTALKRASLIAEKAVNISSKPMAWAENANRINTFKVAFANAFMVEQSRYSHHQSKLKEKLGREPLKKDIYDAIEHAAGNIANDMVRTLHYDYDSWARARILRSKPGKVIGQYQHFKFAFFDMQYNLVKDFARDVKDFNFTEIDPITGKNQVSESFSRMFRMASLYSLIPGLAGIAFNSDVGGIFSTFGSPFKEDRAEEGTQRSGVGLIENPILEDVSKLYHYMAADDSKGKYAAYYGKNPITAQLGPFVSDLLTGAELLDFWNQTDEEYEEHRNLNYDPTNSDWWYNVARIFNVQGARSGWHTIPALLKGQMEKAFRVETGIFQPRWMKNWRKGVMQTAADYTYNKSSVLPDVDIRTGKKKTSKVNRAALDALMGL